MLAFLLLYLSVLMWRKPRPRWSEAESRCAAQLRMIPSDYVAKAMTEMEQSGIEVRTAAWSRAPIGREPATEM